MKKSGHHGDTAYTTCDFDTGETEVNSYRGSLQLGE